MTAGKYSGQIRCSKVGSIMGYKYFILDMLNTQEKESLGMPEGEPIYWALRLDTGHKFFYVFSSTENYIEGLELTDE
jgi:hypothetical protein